MARTFDFTLLPYMPSTPPSNDPFGAHFDLCPFSASGPDVLKILGYNPGCLCHDRARLLKIQSQVRAPLRRLWRARRTRSAPDVQPQTPKKGHSK